MQKRSLTPPRGTPPRRVLVVVICLLALVLVGGLAVIGYAASAAAGDAASSPQAAVAGTNPTSDRSSGMPDLGEGTSGPAAQGAQSTVPTETSIASSADEPATPVAAEEVTPAAPPTTEVPAPVFEFSITPIDEGLKSEMIEHGVWSPEAPVGLDELRVLHVNYWGFDGNVHSGRLVVNHAWAPQLATVFEKIFDARFPILRMDPVDYLGATGEGVEASNNTMSYNGRKMRGGSSWSMHAYGLALDINPVENPCIKGDSVVPTPGKNFVDRSQDAPGMLHPDGVVMQAFKEIGWKWGGDWKSFKDYMHFSSNGK